MFKTVTLDAQELTSLHNLVLHCLLNDKKKRSKFCPKTRCTQGTFRLSSFTPLGYSLTSLSRTCTFLVLLGEVKCLKSIRGKCQNCNCNQFSQPSLQKKNVSLHKAPFKGNLLFSSLPIFIFGDAYYTISAD